MKKAFYQHRFYSYFLCFVGSVSTYCCPRLGVGGSGSPRVTVTSVRVVVFLYCPDLGAFMPGVKVGFVAICAVRKRRLILEGDTCGYSVQPA
jgi:hypothetical protein